MDDEKEKFKELMELIDVEEMNKTNRREFLITGKIAIFLLLWLISLVLIKLIVYGEI